MEKSACVFLDRDGVLNRERGDYTYRTEDFDILPGVPEALKLLRENGFLLIVITNQAGIAKGLYSKADVLACHEKLQESCGNILDALYYAPLHPSVSESLARKPDSLMLEKAIVKFNIDPERSWMVGDKMRDLEAAEKVNVNAILAGNAENKPYPLRANNLREAASLILGKQKNR